MALHYKQPKYYDKFSCIGGKCTNSCCAGWSIDWLKSEVEKLKNAECSAELRSVVEKSFQPKAAHFCIVLKDNNDCPFHNDEGLCMIQKELGEEYLSITCSKYPRRTVIHGQTVTRSCSCSCPAVLDLLFEDSSAMRMEVKNIHSDFKSTVGMINDTQERVDKTPVLFFREQIGDFYNKIITDKNISLETAIILGALASKRFTDVADSDKVIEIPAIIKEYEGKLRDKATIKAIEDIKANREIQFKLVNNLAVTFFSRLMPFDLSVLHDGERVISEKYEKGMELFAETFKGREYFLKNLAANILLDFYMPFFDIEHSILENYIYYALTVAAFKVMGAAIALKSENIEADFKHAVSMLSRMMFHSPDEAKKVMDYLGKVGINSAAHVAFIIK